MTLFNLNPVPEIWIFKADAPEANVGNVFVFIHAAEIYNGIIIVEVAGNFDFGFVGEGWNLIFVGNIHNTVFCHIVFELAKVPGF